MIEAAKHFLNLCLNLVKKLFSINIEIGKAIKQVKKNSLIFFPCQLNTFSCGISAFVAFKASSDPNHLNLDPIQEMVLSLKTKSLSSDVLSIRDDFPGSDDLLNALFEECQGFKQVFLMKEKETFFYLFQKQLNN
ncbi:hypothetical protein [Desulfobacula sp.]|uniref:hypothetical protein n=1 Tax=Desulfobacula sp. TaxID=2593537 RepID=UPI0025C075DB|nr:hypothetical protein [Desulfobacula sp.]